jgi:hypothetical protein
METGSEVNDDNGDFNDLPLIDPDTVSKEEFIALLRDVTATLKETKRQQSAANSRSKPTHTINVGNLEKLQCDISLHDFILWREQWEQTYHLQNIHTFPRESQVFALKSTFSLEMVNKVLNIPEDAKRDDILNASQGSSNNKKRCH